MPGELLEPDAEGAEKKESFCQICRSVSGKRKDREKDNVSRTKQESKRRRREIADLLVSPRPTESWHNGASLAEKLEQTGSGEKQRVVSVPQSEHLANTPELLLPKGKGPQSSVQITRW